MKTTKSNTKKTSVTSISYLSIKKYKILSTLILIFGLFISSCKKEEVPTPTAPTTTRSLPTYLNFTFNDSSDKWRSVSTKAFIDPDLASSGIFSLDVEGTAADNTKMTLLNIGKATPTTYSFLMGIYNTSTDSYESKNSGPSYQLTVTELDTVAYYVKGTFAFKMGASFNPDSLTVTGGEFAAYYK